MQSKFLIPLYGLMLCLVVGCGAKSKVRTPANTDPVSATNVQVPPDTPERFLDRYGRFVPSSYRKELERIDKRLKELRKSSAPQAEQDVLTARRQQLIAQFWTEHEKEPIDERIDDIAREALATLPEMHLITFGSNRGYQGDLATVYLLHGKPDEILATSGNNQFVDLVLWIYNDDSGEIDQATFRDRERFRFLFYRKYGYYQLFRMQANRNGIQAFNEIAQMPDPNITIGMSELTADMRTMLEALKAQGQEFVDALISFSFYSDLTVDKALEPPESLTELAKKVGSRIIGQPNPKETNDLVHASCSSCGAIIPATVDLRALTLTVRREDLDWQVQGDAFTTQLIIEFLVFDPDLVLGSHITIRTPKTSENPTPRNSVTMPLLPPEQIAKLPPGSHRVTIFLYDPLTKRTNTWDVTVTR